MSTGGLTGFYDDKIIFVTGCTGFIGKILVEKMLRSFPRVARLYLLVRAADSESANTRLQQEVFSSSLYRVLQQKHGQGLQSFVENKVIAVAGDVSANEELGIRDKSLLKEMREQVQVVFNVSANTKFNERYDMAVAVNTKGALHVLRFCERCSSLSMLLHVSTAYVNARVEGFVKETSVELRHYSSDDEQSSDIRTVEAELQFVEKTVRDINCKDIPSKEKAIFFKKLGMERARKFGWENCYTLTKAMAEILLCNASENLPLVIVRPAIVESTYAEPFAGWTEGQRTINAFILPYVKGELQAFVGDPQAIVDVVPADYVVKAMLVAAAAHGGESHMQRTYHVSSSSENPLFLSKLVEYGNTFFRAKPLSGKNGKTVTVSSLTLLDRKGFCRYGILVKFVKALNWISCNILSSVYEPLQRVYICSTVLSELFEPFLHSKARFDDNAIKELLLKSVSSKKDKELLSFEVKDIKWKNYFCDVHFPGVLYKFQSY